MRILTPLILVTALVLLFLNTCLFTVNEAQRAMTVRLGQLESDPPLKEGEEPRVRIFTPGLHFKLPLIDNVLLFDTRLHMSELPSARIVTVEKKDLIVDLFVKWRIQNFPLFYTSTFGGSSSALDGRDRATMLLNQKVVDSLRAEFGRKTIRQVVSEDRGTLMETLRQDTDRIVSGFGIHVVDVRIKRIDLPPEVSGAVFDRMRSERKQFATEIRANGEAKGETIRAKAERERRVMLATAKKQAETTRGEGDALAVDIFAKSYSQAPEFFEFYRTLEAYKTVFPGKQDIFVLSPNMAFFKYFNQK
jgi:modulator of FtsH protease HflC